MAHRLSTIRNAHKIIVIEAGRMVEIGTHNELIEAKGLYYNMALLQQQHFAQEETTLEGDVDVDDVELKKSPLRSRMSRLDSVKGSIVKISKTADEEKPENESLPVKRLLKLILPDRWLLTIATTSSFIVGLSIPVYSFLFGEILGVISNLDKNHIEDSVLKYALIYLAMGVVAGLLNFTQVRLVSDY